ncbi:hypothetical protein RF11_13836 [Thelohanellus kitauei]|uniref:Uncharacterized protein n=1 Tax=Thelohanellus kitauei TaxID=669202 RepID=A0A0C2M5X0_THEKT|nr:hypothetical protein RF11_13836 [Thelohanellus kitauei]
MENDGDVMKQQSNHFVDKFILFYAMCIHYIQTWDRSNDVSKLLFAFFTKTIIPGRSSAVHNNRLFDQTISVAKYATADMIERWEESETKAGQSDFKSTAIATLVTCDCPIQGRIPASHPSVCTVDRVLPDFHWLNIHPILSALKGCGNKETIARWEARKAYIIEEFSGLLERQKDVKSKKSETMIRATGRRQKNEDSCLLLRKKYNA